MHGSRFEMLGVKGMIVLGVTLEPLDHFGAFRMLGLAKDLQKVRIARLASAIFGRASTLARNAKWILLLRLSQ